MVKQVEGQYLTFDAQGVLYNLSGRSTSRLDLASTLGNRQRSVQCK